MINLKFYNPKLTIKKKVKGSFTKVDKWLEEFIVIKNLKNVREIKHIRKIIASTFEEGLRDYKKQHGIR